MEKEDVALVIEEYKNKPGGLIALLEAIQKLRGHLPEETLRQVAERTGRSLVDVFGVATFYRAFSLKPRGKHLALVCLGTACHVRGAPKILEEFEAQLGIKAGETTADKEFTVESVNCLGACALGPTVVVDGHYFSHVNKKKVKEIITKTKRGLGKTDLKTDKRMFPIAVFCPACKKSLMDPGFPIDGHPSIKCECAVDGRRGWLRLSSIYGSYAIASEHEIPERSLSRLSCPHCRNEFDSLSDCAECGSPMAALLIRDGCTVEICTRRGCRGHLLNLNQNPLNAASQGK